MTILKNAGRDEDARMDYKTRKFEIGEIQRVYTHNVPGDYNWCVCDVLILDAVQNDPAAAKLTKAQPHIKRVPVNQRSIGNRYGNPWTPSVGDMVLCGFDENDKIIILGTAFNNFQRPPCRSSAHPGSHIDPETLQDMGAYEDINAGYYDWVFKIRQFQSPSLKYNETYFNHPLGPEDESKNRPVCFKYFDKTRDLVIVDECLAGQLEPNCAKCKLDAGNNGCNTGPDLIKCETCCCSATGAANSWLKILGSSYEGKDDLKRRTKYHHNCGSLLCLDGYDCQEGRIWLEEQVRHQHRSHINFQPDKGGTMGIGANLSIRSDLKNAAHVQLFGVKSPLKGRVWLSNEDKGNFVDIKETGDIFVSAAPSRVVYIYGPEEVIVQSDKKITLDAPVTEVTGDLVIDGECFHHICSCNKCEGDGVGIDDGYGSPVSQVIPHGLVDDNNQPLQPRECSAFCTCGGGSCTINYCDDTNICITCTIGVTFRWSVGK